ncbi:hypothetical protein GCM10011609_60170 [Lentzea pudingi]|uniref:OmpR/PhoB-type domain-containing protein n=1 Tax=Lentzea pudingi TaxID=1789439 RepID=A0ABQ2IJ61_9PSEU|nr:AfsR/SARP family transcriptional regulator [Lentzea pudingi]GGN11961.1 hypothetical protein GCM10011609_60170 [Lentzea pudingi]
MIAEYRVLGPLEVLLDGTPVAVPAGRSRVLLATLLLRANEFVPVDELVERVWDGEPPAPDRAHKTLQTVVMRLRQSLGAANCVRTSSRGYSAEVEPGQLDLARFRALTARGEHRAALELWRGPVLGNVASDSLHHEDVPSLLEEQIVALERRIDEDLDRATDVLVPELRSLVRRHPLRETFWAQLVLALHRAGQQAEALATYQEVRARLADELGVDPGLRLREAHEQVLSGEVPAQAVVPRQLPAAPAYFVGREDELARMTEMAEARPGVPVLISAINGIGGVGKTTLALRWAHQVAGRYPDGQLHVDLRGFDPRAEPLDPFGVARDFLAALGVAPATLGTLTDEAAVAEYRSTLARRRVLVVLDNARNAEQVRPLLPGGTGNLVLVTSRNHLSGLVAREGARPVALDVLAERAATDLLVERIGADRAAAEPDAVSRLVERCAGLPLALGVVAARAAYGDSLAVLADELERERLDALDIDDPTTGVRSVFSWSLRSISEPAARLFVLLGLHPGPDFAVEAAASLTALPWEEARRALRELVDRSLLTATDNGRFSLHDLLRDYAAERVAELPEEERGAALRRMLDHYLHTAHASWQQLQFNISPIVTEPPAAGVVLEPVTDADTAWAVFGAEHRVMLNTVERAGGFEAHDFIWKMMFVMHGYLCREGYLHEALRVEVAEAFRRRQPAAVPGGDVVEPCGRRSGARSRPATSSRRRTCGAGSRSPTRSRAASRRRSTCWRTFIRAWRGMATATRWGVTSPRSAEPTTTRVMAPARSNSARARPGSSVRPSTTARKRRPRATSRRWATSTSVSAGTTRPSRATSGRWRCGGGCGTGPTAPTASSCSGRLSSRQGVPAAAGTPSSRRWSSSTPRGTRTTSTAPTCRRHGT